MTLEIKICGMKTAEAIDAAVKGGATHVGFIFFDKSPRNVDVDTALMLAARAHEGGAKAVAVTVDADKRELDNIVASVKPDLLQLHGSETPERVSEIKARYGLPVMKVLTINEATDLARVIPYLGIADRFMFDAKPPKGSELPGGNGVAFDWHILAKLDGNVDYMLSGGLDADNVGEALAVSGAKAVDVSSGVESKPGVKDTKKIAAFLKATRTADEAGKAGAN
jgi:phosphoribosylanthranilate isomerase